MANTKQQNSIAYFRPATQAQGLANYPHARMIPAGPGSYTIYVSGTSSRRGDGTFVGAEATENSDGSSTLRLDVQKQTEAVLFNIDAILQGITDGKANIHNVVDATVFLTNISGDYNGMNAAWNSVWPDRATAPARTTVEVRKLPRDEILVEIKCTAYISHYA